MKKRRKKRRLRKIRYPKNWDVRTWYSGLAITTLAKEWVITPVKPRDATRFKVGDWVLVAGLDIQGPDPIKGTDYLRVAAIDQKRGTIYLAR